MSRMPLRGLGWPGGGRDVYIENKENRFADRNALGEWIFETTWTTRDNSFKVAGLDNSARLEGTNEEREGRKRQTGQRGTRLGEGRGKDAWKRPAPTFRQGGARGLNKGGGRG